MNNKIKEILSIIVVTYNRREKLKRTLDSLLSSPVSDCRITILNNHSNDGTLELCEEYEKIFSNCKIITHPVNLGSGSANIIQSVFYCNTDYMWILADDDTFDFSSFDDVQNELSKGVADIIQVGAHNDGEWNWGVTDTPVNLKKRGYNYLKYSSFIPCSIIKYSYFVQYIEEAFYFVAFRYPHMPSLIGAFDRDIPIYVSKKRIVTASIGGQRYDEFVIYRGLIMAIGLACKKENGRILLESLYGRHNRLTRFCLSILYNYWEKDDVILLCAKIFRCMKWYEKMQFFILLAPICLLKLFKNKTANLKKA